MTSEPSQIQTLIHQIDEVLNKTSPRLPWVMSSDAVQQRQVLEQARNCLLSLQKENTNEPARSDQQGGVSGQGASAPQGMTPAQSVAAAELSAQQVLQAVVQEMNYLRANTLQPLRSEVEMMRLQRDALAQELRQLEQQRQHYALPQQNAAYIAEFLQASMAQMQENLMGQVAQMMATMASPDPQRLANHPSAGALGAADLSSLSPIERLERLQTIQSQSDELLLRLDTTLRVVFESLQRNLQSYQDSLEEGLGRMHDMGQHGEAVFAAFVTRLAQILGREASSFLQDQPGDWRTDHPSLPGHGEELPGDNPDAQITRLMEELNALDPSALAQGGSGEPLPFDIDQPDFDIDQPTIQPPNATLSPEAELETLEELDRELSQLDLSAIPTDVEFTSEYSSEPIAVFRDDRFFPFPPFEDEGDDQPIQKSAAIPESELDFDLEVDRVTTDDELDSALDLLNQVTTDSSVDDGSDESNLGDTNSAGFLGAEASNATNAAINPADPSLEPDSFEPNLVSTPDSLYTDEFYQSLFGQDTVGQSTSEQEPSASRPAEDSDLFFPSPETDPDAVMEAPSFSDSNDADLVDLNNASLDNASLDIDADLFAGLTDPAQREGNADESDDRSLFGIQSNLEPTDVPQSVEALLLQPTPPAPSAELTLDDLLMDDVPDAEDVAAPSDEDEDLIETIASLSDLIPSTDRTAPTEGTDSVQPEPSSQSQTTSEEDYETAQPDEDLLATDTTLPTDAQPDFRLPPDILNQLAADLSNLEDATDDTIASLSVTNEADWTLADLGSSFNADAQNAGFPSESAAEDWSDANSAFTEPDEITVEDLLFTDDLAAEPSPNPSSSPEIEPLSSRDTSPNPRFAGANELLESTIEDWFANVESSPTVMSEAGNEQTETGRATEIDNTADLFGWQTTQDTSAEALNAFTLEGLDSLFENVPPKEPPPRVPSETDTQRVTLDDVFSDVKEPSIDEPSDHPLGNPNTSVDREPRSSSTHISSPGAPSSDQTEDVKKKAQV